MPNRSNVRSNNRAVALILALIWFCAGVAAIVFGYIHGRWLLLALGIFALWYALLWCRVVARARLLTWRELAVPWRTQ